MSEPLRDQIGCVLYEEDGIRDDWHSLSEDRKEPWRKDADRVLKLLVARINGETDDKATENSR